MEEKHCLFKDQNKHNKVEISNQIKSCITRRAVLRNV